MPSEIEWPDVLTEVHRQIDPVARSIAKVDQWTQHHDERHRRDAQAAQDTARSARQSRITALIATCAAVAAVVVPIIDALH